eukprot:8417231-Alexandrium_andersonii.AAC.1
MAAGVWKDVLESLWQRATQCVMLALADVDVAMRDNTLKDWQSGRSHLYKYVTSKLAFWQHAPHALRALGLPDQSKARDALLK